MKRKIGDSEGDRLNNHKLHFRAMRILCSIWAVAHEKVFFQHQKAIGKRSCLSQ